MGDRGAMVTENNRRALALVRVKRRGKSPPGDMVTCRAAPPVSCKVKYTGTTEAARFRRGVDRYFATMAIYPLSNVRDR